MISYKSFSDEALIDKYYHGDDHAFTEIDTRHRRAFCRYVAKRGFSNEDAEEIAGQALIKIAATKGGPSAYNPARGASFKTWAFTIVKNKTRDKSIKILAKAITVINSEVLNTIPAKGPGDAGRIRDIFVETLNTIIAGIPPAIRDVLGENLKTAITDIDKGNQGGFTSPGNSPEEEILKDRIFECLKVLPIPHLVIIVYIFWMHWKNGEIAEVLGVSNATITNYKNEAMRILGDCLEG